MPTRQTIQLPAQFAINVKIEGNSVQRLSRPGGSYVAETQPYGQHAATLAVLTDGTRILVVPHRIAPPSDVDETLLLTDEDALVNILDGGLDLRARWLKPQPVGYRDVACTELEKLTHSVSNSWQEQFFFLEEQLENGQTKREGLRTPQLGALFATLGYWKTSNASATIVMPTGTGKTETMLAILVCERLKRVLVVVPTSALREQIGMKFLSLGVLRQCQVLGEQAQLPLVGIMKHRPKTQEEVETYFRCCNVIVTTMNVISGCLDEVQDKMADLCSHLFIDEAHHNTAPTWEKFRRFFTEKTILQFTATPFRTDGKSVDGKIIFNYPLRKAQAENYFQPINFKPIEAYDIDEADRLIAQTAIEQLEADLSKGLDHIVMARAASIERATKIYNFYQRLANAHSPVLVHSEKSEAEKRTLIRQLLQRKSRVVICVNMFGEGFDLPELKIAALHDVHKSLAVTLQFTGRFTRTKSSIGRATIIANIADPQVEESLQDLYAEDPDWNSLLPRLSEGATGKQVQRTEFLQDFMDVPPEISLQNIFPKMSTVVYHTKCATWKPEGIYDEIKQQRLYAGPTINRKQKVLLFITREREPVPWGDVKDIYNIIWDLYLLHWDVQQNLLFINSSNNDSLHIELLQHRKTGPKPMVEFEHQKEDQNEEEPVYRGANCLCAP